jgi:hypothetical protein
MRSLALCAVLSAAWACARDVGGGAPGAARPYDTTCTLDGDCAPAPGCCPAPCTSQVLHVKELPRAREELRCDPKEVCPQAGGCITHRYLCVRNQCKLVFEGDADYRE